MFKVFSNNSVIGEFATVEEAQAAASAAVKAGGVNVHILVPDGWTPPA